MVIGLTVVAFGTSAPEMAVSVQSSLAGQADIAVGNVVGSNIFNILSVLGLTALVAPDGVPVSAAAAAFDIPVMVAVAVMTLPIFFTNNLIERWEGGLFLFYYVAYTAYLILEATQHHALPLLNNVLLFAVIPITMVTLAVLFATEFAHRRKATA